jgi:hypothetical protein
LPCSDAAWDARSSSDASAILIKEGPVPLFRDLLATLLEPLTIRLASYSHYGKVMVMLALHAHLWMHAYYIDLAHPNYTLTERGTALKHTLDASNRCRQCWMFEEPSIEDSHRTPYQNVALE